MRENHLHVIASQLRRTLPAEAGLTEARTEQGEPSRIPVENGLWIQRDDDRQLRLRQGRLGGLCVGDAVRQAVARVALATYSSRYEVPACGGADNRAGAARPARW
jgi:hypothetical protein